MITRGIKPNYVTMVYPLSYTVLLPQQPEYNMKSDHNTEESDGRSFDKTGLWAHLMVTHMSLHPQNDHSQS